MSNIDKQALREAAEKATPGLWVYLPKNTSIEYDYGSDDSQGSITYMDSGDFTQKQTDLNGAFIAAANPATVLALLDELEVVNELFLRAKALMYQSGGTPIENSLNPIDAWLYDAERAAAAGKGDAS
ncbi:ead/Ea22-like family protein [Enterobacter rongchengensis]|uniref:Ead/Ea22-like family protein n=1 Tax=Enterobacter rongchengensis TaxID=3030999 RepID=A0ABV4JGP5_9ENTR